MVYFLISKLHSILAVVGNLTPGNLTPGNLTLGNLTPSNLNPGNLTPKMFFLVVKYSYSFNKFITMNIFSLLE